MVASENLNYLPLLLLVDEIESDSDPDSKLESVELEFEAE